MNNIAHNPSLNNFWFVDKTNKDKLIMKLSGAVTISIWTKKVVWTCTTLYDKFCQWLATGGWFSPGTLVSSTNKTDRHAITEICLKMALLTIKQTIKTDHELHTFMSDTSYIYMIYSHWLCDNKLDMLIFCAKIICH
jgi:hypothetical protein